MYIALGLIPYEGCEVKDIEKCITDVDANKYYNYRGKTGHIYRDKPLNYKNYPFYIRFLNLDTLTFEDKTVEDALILADNDNVKLTLSYFHSYHHNGFTELDADSNARTWHLPIYSPSMFLYVNDEIKFYVVGRPSAPELDFPEHSHTTPGEIYYFIWNNKPYIALNADRLKFYLPSYNFENRLKANVGELEVYVGEHLFILKSYRFKNGVEDYLPDPLYKGYTLFFEDDYYFPRYFSKANWEHQEYCNFMEEDIDLDLAGYIHREYDENKMVNYQSWLKIQQDATMLIAQTDLADEVGGKSKLVKELISKNLFKERL